MEQYDRLLLILIIGSISFLACTDLSDYDNRQIKNALADSLLNSTESWGFSLELFEDNEKVMLMTGSHSVTINRNDGDETRISGPVSILMYKNGRNTTHASSDSALYLTANGIFELFGTVRVTTSDSTKLRTEYLKWNRHDDKVSTEYFVEFITPPDSITSVGFIGNSALTEYTLNQMSGEVVID